MHRAGSQILTAELGPRVAALTAQVDCQTVAVVNCAAADDPVLYEEAVQALRGAGLIPDHRRLSEVLHGVRS